MQIIVSAKHAITAIFEDIKMSWFSEFLFGTNNRKESNKWQNISDSLHVIDFFPFGTEKVFTYTPKVDLKNDPIVIRFNKLYELLNDSSIKWNSKYNMNSNSIYVYELDFKTINLHNMPDGKGGLVSISFQWALDISNDNIPFNLNITISRSKYTPHVAGLNPMELCPKNEKLLSVEGCFEIIETLIDNQDLIIKPYRHKRYKAYGFNDGKYWKKDNIIIKADAGSLNIYKLVNGLVEHIEFKCSFREERESFLRKAINTLNELGPKDSSWVEIDSPKIIWAEAFASTKAKELADRYKEISAHMDYIFASYKQVADSMINHGGGFIAPIKCYDSYMSFLKIMKSKIIYVQSANLINHREI
jgi:hypothetical protein